MILNTFPCFLFLTVEPPFPNEILQGTHPQGGPSVASALTQQAARLLSVSPPPLPGRLDPGAVRLPFPSEELLLDAGFRALRTKGTGREA